MPHTHNHHHCPCPLWMIFTLDNDSISILESQVDMSGCIAKNQKIHQTLYKQQNYVYLLYRLCIKHLCVIYKNWNSILYFLNCFIMISIISTIADNVDYDESCSELENHSNGIVCNCIYIFS